MGEELFRFLSVRSPQVPQDRVLRQYTLHYPGPALQEQDYPRRQWPQPHAEYSFEEGIEQESSQPLQFPPLVEDLKEALVDGSVVDSRRLASDYLMAHGDLVGGASGQSSTEEVAIAKSLTDVHAQIVEVVESGEWGERAAEELKEAIEGLLGTEIDRFVEDDDYEIVNTALWNLYYASVAAGGLGTRQYVDGHSSAASGALLERIVATLQASAALHLWLSQFDDVELSRIGRLLDAYPVWPAELWPLICGSPDLDDEASSEEESSEPGESEESGASANQLVEEIEDLRQVRDKIRSVTQLLLEKNKSEWWEADDVEPLQISTAHFSEMDDPYGYAAVLTEVGISYIDRPVSEVVDDINVEIANLLGELYEAEHQNADSVLSLPMGPLLAGKAMQTDDERSRSEVLGLSEDPSVPTTTGQARVLGVGDLIRVEEELLRYEPAEVAHIENVLQSEFRERTHRRLNRSEEFFEVEEVTEKEEERDLETAERFEMQQEAEATVEQEKKVSAGVDVTAKYGSVKINTTTDFARTTSKRDANKTARDYSRDVTQRSLKRVRSKVRERRTRRIIQETEETNVHRFDNITNPAGGHITGIYRFANKVIEAQLVNYGQRLMLEFTVPEPAAFLRETVGTLQSGNIEKPQPPSFSPTDLDETNYWIPARFYGVPGIKPPPPEWKVETLPLDSGGEQMSSEDGVGDGGPSQPVQTDKSSKLEVPPGYRAKIGSISGNVNYAAEELVEHVKDVSSGKFKGTTGDWGDLELLASAGLHPYLSISVGTRTVEASGTMWMIGSSGGLFGGSDGKFSITEDAVDLRDRVDRDHDAGGKVSTHSWPTEDGNPKDGGSDLLSTAWVMNNENGTVAVSTVESFLDGFGLTIEILCQRTPEEFARWQQETYDAVWAAYEKQLSEYEDRVRAEQVTAGSEIQGRNPARNRDVIQDELKKHCITLMTNQWYDDFDAVRSRVPPHGYPEINPKEARAEGEYIAFFEQAFEWDQMTYTFYPYFWGRKENWPIVTSIEDIDPHYQGFLRAGAARVVVPVRPPLNEAVAYYLICGDIWKGGDPPTLEDEMYTSIVTELKEAKNAPRDGVPIEEPWTYVVPTSLIWLQRDTDENPEAALPNLEEERSGSS